jgi:hypothetical protein
VSPFNNLIFSSKDPTAKKRELLENLTVLIPSAKL